MLPIYYRGRLQRVSAAVQYFHGRQRGTVNGERDEIIRGESRLHDPVVIVASAVKSCELSCSCTAVTGIFIRGYVQHAFGSQIDRVCSPCLDGSGNNRGNRLATRPRDEIRTFFSLRVHVGKLRDAGRSSRGHFFLVNASSR